MPEPAPDQAGADDGQDEVQRNRAQSQPDRSVARCERNDRRQTERGVGIHDGHDDVDGQEDEAEQRDRFVQLGGEETGPTRTLPADRGQDAQTDDGGQ